MKQRCITATALLRRYKAKMNQVSLDASAPYTVTYSEDMGAMVFPRPVVNDRSFFIVNDDLLETTGFQNAMVCRTGVNRDVWTPDFRETHAVRCNILALEDDQQTT